MRQYTSDRRVIARCPSGSGWGQLIVLIAMFLAVPARGQTVIYVDTDAVGANDGTSWADAFVYLQDALAVAQDGNEVWVAEGVYRPDQGAGITLGDREASFHVSRSFQLFGGFSGIESNRSARDPATHVARLSGDLLSNDGPRGDWESISRSDNSHHVVMVETDGLVSPVRLSGIVISDGHAEGEYEQSIGAGIRSAGGGELILDNSVIEYNFAGQCGGGIFAEGTVRLSFTVIRFNHADAEYQGCSPGGSGGGANINMSGALGATYPGSLIEDTVFEGNTSSGRAGGLGSGGGVLTVVNSLFVANGAGTQGGGAYHSYTSEMATLYINSRFLGNEAGAGPSPYRDGGGMHIVSTRVALVNTLFAGNRVIDLPNQTDNDGGAISLNETGALTVVNSTFARNEARYGGAIWASWKTDLEVYNSIIWENRSSTGPALDKSTSLSGDWNDAIVGATISQDGIPERFVGIGEVLTEDPRFSDPDGHDGISGTIDDDYRLAATSPAIDRGDTAYLPTDSLDLDGDGDTGEQIPIDLDGRSRVVCGTSNVCGLDLGPYESTDTSHSNEALLPDEMIFGISDPYPNPTVDRTSVEMTGVGEGWISIHVMNVLGRRIQTIPYLPVRSPGAPRVFQVDLSSVSTGMYFLVVTSGSHRTVRSIVRK